MDDGRKIRKKVKVLVGRQKKHKKAGERSGWKAEET